MKIIPQWRPHAHSANTPHTQKKSRDTRENRQAAHLLTRAAPPYPRADKTHPHDVRARPHNAVKRQPVKQDSRRKLRQRQASDPTV